jgi:serine/threonine-protein kinase
VEGTQIGSYQIERTLGKGGFGVVYVAMDVRLGRRAAIKQLLPELTNNREIVERFFNEAKAAASINHPGIVEIYDVGWHTDGSAYFAMKLLDGDSLGKRLKATGPMPEELAATIARQVASALVAAHARGIVHRDLKPDNIVLVADDEVTIGERAILLDFGIAKLFGDQPLSQRTRTGMMMGTPDYMSPEQCRGAGEVDHRTDVYALGCILFEMLTGRPPFVGAGGGEVLGMHQFVDAPTVRSLRPDISPALEALVMRMLVKKPEDRIQLMSEVAAALHPFSTHATRMMDQVSQRASAERSGAVPAPTVMTGYPGRAPGTDHPIVQPGQSMRAPELAPLSTYTRGEVTGGAPPPKRRRGLVLGLVGGGVAVAGIAVAAVVASGGSSKKHVAHDASIAAADAALIVEHTPDAAVLLTPTPDAAPIVASIDAGTGAPLVDEKLALRAECKALLDKRAWVDANNCGTRLEKLDAGFGKTIRDRAVSEAKAEASLRVLGDALKEGNLKQARTTLDAIPETSVYRKAAQAKYDAAERSAVDSLVVELKQLAAQPTCKNFNTRLRQAEAVSGRQVADQARSQVKCSNSGPPPPPPGPCDFDELVQKANSMVASGNHAAALQAFEQAFKCKPEQRIVVRIFMEACNGRNAAKAKQYFKQLPPNRQRQLLQLCIRNGIDPEN